MRIYWHRNRALAVGASIILFLFICVVYFRAPFSTSQLDSPQVVGQWDFLLSLGISADTYASRLKRFANYVASEGKRSGVGEQGASVQLTAEEQKEADARFSKDAFNKIASDKVALDRSLPDVRMVECRSLTYPADLPTASVIIIFHNEAWSPLLRTVHSVVNRSPPRYLKEIVMLDDASYNKDLGHDLDDYVSRTWPDGVVRIVRETARQGLIRARLAGAKAAHGDVIIFLDSHCEATQGWLEPMLARIRESRQAVLCPQIDSVSDHDIGYYGHTSPVSMVGSFWWSGHFTWDSVPPEEVKRRQRETDPVRSPTMAGGLFAVNREYFFELGAYDEGMEIWGGENLELSFRTWMCGGTLEFIPCSHVGHIFRASHPYTFPGNKDYHGINTLRLVEVWLDEYKRLFYMHRKDLLNKDYGDVSSRKTLRQRLGCKSFQWYIDNVIPQKFIPDRNVTAYGMLRNPSSQLCIDLLGQNEFDRGHLKANLYNCQGGVSGAQLFTLSKDGLIRREWGCLTVQQFSAEVLFLTCSGQSASAIHWRHDKNSGQVLHINRQLCLDTANLKATDTVQVKPCDLSSHTQKWNFEFYS